MNCTKDEACVVPDVCLACKVNMVCDMCLACEVYRACGGLMSLRYTWPVNVHDVFFTYKSCTVHGLGCEKLGTIVMSSNADFTAGHLVPSALSQVLTR